jgi:hypothetical protein
MKPAVAGVAFGVGIGCGLFIAHETEETSHRYVVEELQVETEGNKLCHQHLEEAGQVLEIQQALLTKQLKVLEDICPIVRRAVVGWPWCPPLAVQAEEEWK